MKFMKNKQVLPIPFLILILAGLVSLFSIVATRRSPASTVRDDSLQMQTVEQERMAAIYFRDFVLAFRRYAAGDGTRESQPPTRPHITGRKNPAAPGAPEPR